MIFLTSFDYEMFEANLYEEGGGLDEEKLISHVLANHSLTKETRKSLVEKEVWSVILSSPVVCAAVCTKDIGHSYVDKFIDLVRCVSGKKLNGLDCQEEYLDLIYSGNPCRIVIVKNDYTFKASKPFLVVTLDKGSTLCGSIDDKPEFYSDYLPIYTAVYVEKDSVFRLRPHKNQKHSTLLVFG